MAYQKVSVPFGTGMDTKTDPKMLDQPALVQAQDCIFTNKKRLTKRNGYDISTTALVGGGTWSNPTMTAKYNNQFLLAATTSNGKRLLSYSETLSAWQDVGPYECVSSTRQYVTGSTPLTYTTGTGQLTSGVNSSAAVLGNIALFSYEYTDEYGKASSDNKSYFSIIDLSTGTVIANQVLIAASRGFARAVVLGQGSNSSLAISYISSNGSNSLRFVIISVTSSGGYSVGSEITIGTCDSGNTLWAYVYDFVNTSSGGIWAVGDSSGSRLTCYAFSPTGSSLGGSFISPTGDYSAIHINQDATGNVWLYYGLASSITVVIFTSSLSSEILGPTVLVTGLSNIHQITATASPSIQTVFYSLYVTPSGYGGVYANTYSGTITTGGVFSGGGGVPIFNLDIYGRAFLYNSNYYLPCVSLSYGNGASGLLYNCTTGNFCGKFIQTAAEGLYQAGQTTGASYTAPVLNGVRYPSFLNNSYVLSDTSQFLFGASAIISTNIVTTTFAGSPTNLDSFAVETQKLTPSMAPVYVILDFNDPDAYQTKSFNNTLVLNGSIVRMYDGTRCVELQFSIDPDNLSLKGQTSGGSYTTGNLIYYYTYEYIDSNGNLYESAPSGGFGISFTTGTGNAVELYTNIPTFTDKVVVGVNFWRSDSNEGGNLAYFVGSVEVPNPYLGTNAEVQFLDTLSSAAAAVNPTLYTQNGAILENLSPPPAMILWENDITLYAVNSEDPQIDIEYTKSASPGTGISFSTGQLQVLIDSVGGNITGGSKMDEKNVVLKANGLAYNTGVGANDAGSGSTFTPFQFIPANVGCSNSKSVILFSNGIMFRASNNKGVYLVSRGLEVSYIGAPVEAYNSQDIQSAVSVPNKTQIRFLTSNGSSLLYDYYFNQWSVFTNHAGLSATVFNGLYAYVRSSNNSQDNLSLYTEDQSTFLDNTTAFAPSITMAGIRAEDYQGFDRVRRVMLLGDCQGINTGHGVQISAAYDFSSTFSAPVPYYFTQTPYQYRERLKRQKCDSLQLKIQEIVTGASGEFIDFSDLGIEILAKTGLNKLPGSQSVG